MSNDTASPQQNVPGFWTRLSLALAALGDSYDEDLERRIRRLEAEVERLAKDHGRVAQHRKSA